MGEPTRYLTDGKRHLICVPFSEAGLHRMAEDLNIPRHWFHRGRFAHYDIPQLQRERVEARCELVSSRDIVRIARGEAVAK